MSERTPYSHPDAIQFAHYCREVLARNSAKLRDALSTPRTADFATQLAATQDHITAEITEVVDYMSSNKPMSTGFEKCLLDAFVSLLAAQPEEDVSAFLDILQATMQADISDSLEQAEKDDEAATADLQYWEIDDDEEDDDDDLYNNNGDIEVDVIISY